VASVVNANLLLVYFDVAPTVQFVVGMLSLMGLFGKAMSWIWAVDDATLPLVMVWALVGIAVELKSPKNSIESMFGAHHIAIVQYTAIAGSIVIGTCVILKHIFGIIRAKERDTTADPLWTFLCIFLFVQGIQNAVNNSRKKH
jgi:hypothetical protein